MVHLPFLVGELTCTVARIFIDDVGWLHLKVARLTGIVEEEVHQCTLESSAIPLVDREACTRDLHTKFEVDKVIDLGKFPVGKGFFTEIGSDTARLDADVVLCRSPFGHDIGGEIGDREEDITDLALGFFLLILKFFTELLERSYLYTDGFCLLLSSLLHQIADLLSDRFLTS